MPIKQIFWDGSTGHDVHVLRGGGPSQDLARRALKFRPADGSDPVFAQDYLDLSADVTLTFTPLFKRSESGDLFVGDRNGITVNKKTGVVDVAAAIAINVKNNFIIEVEAKNVADGKVFREAIRFQVHGSLTQVWLTPDQINLFPISAFGPHINTNFRFAVHAQFDDGIIGDLTDGHDVTWSGAGGHVDPTTGRLSLLPGDHAGDTIDVSATLPFRLGGASTPAGPKILIVDSFVHQATPPEYTVVAGSGLPGPTAIEDAANVLFMPDGFRLEDKDAFDRIVDGVVHYLKNSQLTKPYNLLSGRMNYWKLFLPAADRGLSVRSEVALVGLQHFAVPLPAARRPKPDSPPKPPEEWDVSNLLYAVGLPMPGDEAPQRTPAILKAEWATLLQNDPRPNISSDDIVNQWKVYARRTLLEERDGVPALSMGDPPAASNSGTTVLQIHLNRVGPTMLRRVLATLGSTSMALADGRPIGMLWKEEGTAASATTDTAGYAVGAQTVALAAAGTGTIIDGDVITFAGDPQPYVVETGTPNVNGGTIELAAPGLRQAIPAAAVPIAFASLPRFRNRDFVIIISAARGGRPANASFKSGRFIAIGCGRGFKLQVTLAPGATTLADAFPVKASPGKPAFALDLGAVPTSVEADTSRTTAHELSHSLGLGDEYVEFDEPSSAGQSFANLQLEADTQIPDPADPTKRIMNGDQIQWNWHRITAAAVVNGDITPEPGLDIFRIPVVPDVSFRFAVGDTLRLRVRKRGQPLTKLGPLDLSGDLVITEPPESDAIVVRAVHVISAQAFPPGSLLYRPKVAPKSVLSPLYPYAEMVAKNVKEAISKNGKPLLDVPGDNKVPQSPLVDDEDGRKPVLDFHVDGDDLPRVVGLYAGGGTFVSGIFHPTGHCMMRNSDDAHGEFCAVCRYVIVDQLGPDFHPDIDADYEKIYPQR